MTPAARAYALAEVFPQVLASIKQNTLVNAYSTVRLSSLYPYIDAGGRIMFRDHDVSPPVWPQWWCRNNMGGRVHPVAAPHILALWRLGGEAAFKDCSVNYRRQYDPELAVTWRDMVTKAAKDYF